MSNTATNEQASKSESSDTLQERASVDNTDLNLARRKPDKQSLISTINQKVRM